MKPLFLKKSIGNGLKSDQDDVRSVGTALKSIGELDKNSNADDASFLTAEVDDAIRRFQDGAGLKVDGRIDPDGPTEQAINNRIIGKPRGLGLLLEPTKPLTDKVGSALANRPDDVVKVKRELGALGLVPEDPFDRPAQFLDERTTKAIRKFQSDNGLKADGILTPGGETETGVRNAVDETVGFDRLTSLEDIVERFPVDSNLPRLLAEIFRIIFRRPRPAPRDPRQPRTETQTRTQTESLGERGHQPLPPIRPEPQRGPDPDNREGPQNSEGRRPEDPIRNHLPTHLPGFSDDDRPGLIWINPDQSDEIILPIFVENRRGNAATQELNANIASQLRHCAEEVSGGVIEQVGGSRDENNEDRKETHLPPRERSGRRRVIERQRSGASYPDISFEHRGTERRLYINTYDFRPGDSEREPTEREMNAAIRIVYNSLNGDVLLLLPKLTDGTTIDLDSHDNLAKGLMRQIGEETPAIDPRDENAAERLVHIWRNPAIRD